MTQTADVAAREPVSRMPREAVRLGLEPHPETLPSKAAFLYEGVSDGLIPCLKIQEPQRRHITLCAEHPGARHQEPDPRTNAWPFPHASRAPALGCADVYRLGWSPPTLEGHQSRTDRRKHGKQGSLLSEGKGQPFSSEDGQRLRGSQRVFGRSPGRMADDCHVPPSQRHREAPGDGFGTTLPPAWVPSGQ